MKIGIICITLVAIALLVSSISYFKVNEHLVQHEIAAEKQAMWIRVEAFEDLFTRLAKEGKLSNNDWAVLNQLEQQIVTSYFDDELSDTDLYLKQAGAIINDILSNPRK